MHCVLRHPFPLFALACLHVCNAKRLISCNEGLSNLTRLLLSSFLSQYLFQTPSNLLFYPHMHARILALSPLSVKHNSYTQAQKMQLFEVILAPKPPLVISYMCHAATCTVHLIMSSLTEISPGN